MEKEIKGQKTKFLILPLIFLMMAQIGTTTDNVSLGISTMALVDSLKVSIAEVQLANVIYATCAGSFMIIGGMLGIKIGWKKNFRLGALFCAIGELAVALAPNIFILTWVGRVLVGIGGSLLIPSVLGIIPGLYKGKDRAVAFGAIGTAIGLANLIPLVIGYVIDALGWRVVFGCMAIYFAIIFFGTMKMPEVEKSERKVTMDIKGAIMAAVALFMLMIGLSKVSVWGLLEPINAPFTILGISPVLPMVFLGIILLIVLVFIEKSVEEKTGSALLPQSFIKTKQVRTGVLGLFLIFFCMGGYGLVVNPYLQIAGGFNATMLGVATVVMAIPTAIVSTALPKYFSNISVRTVMRVGIIGMAVSSFCMGISLETNGVNAIFWVGFILSGACQGIIAATAPNIVASAVNARDAQQSSGVQATSRNVGKSVGIALLGSIMLFFLSSSMQSTIADSKNLTPETKEVMKAEQSFEFSTDDAFVAKVSEKVTNKDDIQELKKINAEERKTTAQMTIYIMGAISLLFMFGTKNIPHHLDEKEA